MSYELYKRIMTRKEFFSAWESGSLKSLGEEMKEHMYNRYMAKCRIFQRDNFRCQNIHCQSNGKGPLTWHHVKFQKNGGKDTERNGITLCESCHKGFHRAKKILAFSNRKKLPSHIRGHTFRLEMSDVTDQKALRKELKKLRKSCRHLHGAKIGDELLKIIMLFIFGQLG